MHSEHDTPVQSTLTRRDLLTTAGKVTAATVAGAAVLKSASVPTVFASRASSVTTLNFLTGLAGSDGAAMQAIVNAFNKANPDINVKMQIIGSWTEFYTKLLPTLTAGNAPEVFTTHIQEMLYFQDKGLFLKLDDLFGPSLPESDFAPLPMKYAAYQGNIYGMPLDMHGWAFYTNPSLLAKAGLPNRAPADGAELVDWARKLTLDKNGNNGMSAKFDPSHVVQYGIATSWDAPPTFLSTLWSFGGNTISADGKKAMFDTPAMSQAVNFWGDLIFKYHACNKPAGYGANGPWGAYQNNALAMVPDGNWMRSWFVAHPKVAKKANFMPKYGKTQQTWMSGHVIAAPASLPGDKKAAVYKFMHWLSDHGVQWTETAGHIPARISQRTSSKVMSLWPQQVYGPELASIGHIEQPSTVFFDVQDAYIAEIDAAWNGTKSISAALSSAQSRVQKALDGQ